MTSEPASRPLDRDQIVAVALQILKREGAKALSTRRIAGELGIKSASLYHHFRHKQEMMDYVSAAMIQPAWRSPREGERWQEWLADIGHALRDAFASYGEGALVAAGSTPPPEAFRDAVAVLYAPMLAAGFSQEQTRNIIVAVLRFVGGWTFDEQIARSRGVARTGAAAEEGFDFGLRALIAGSELHAARLDRGEARRR